MVATCRHCESELLRGCKCGLYAYHRFNSTRESLWIWATWAFFLIPDISMPFLPAFAFWRLLVIPLLILLFLPFIEKAYLPKVAGIIMARGKIFSYHEGYRAQQAQIVCLLRPWWMSQRQAASLVREYSVPVFKHWPEAEAYAREHGIFKGEQ